MKHHQKNFKAFEVLIEDNLQRSYRDEFAVILECDSVCRHIRARGDNDIALAKLVTEIWECGHVT